MEAPVLNERVVVNEGGFNLFGYIAEIRTSVVFNIGTDVLCTVRLENGEFRVYEAKTLHRVYPVGTFVRVKCPLGDLEAVGVITEIRQQNGGYIVLIDGQGRFGFGWEEVEPPGPSAWDSNFQPFPSVCNLSKMWEEVQTRAKADKPTVWDRVADPDFLS